MSRFLFVTALTFFASLGLAAERMICEVSHGVNSYRDNFVRVLTMATPMMQVLAGVQQQATKTKHWLRQQLKIKVPI